MGTTDVTARVEALARVVEAQGVEIERLRLVLTQAVHALHGIGGMTATVELPGWPDQPEVGAAQ